MAKRGEVLALRRKLGFGAEGKAVLVAPFDVDGPMYDADPLVVHVAAKEAGAKQPHVVLVHLVTAVLVDRFGPGPVGRLAAASLGQVDALLALALAI